MMLGLEGGVWCFGVCFGGKIPDCLDNLKFARKKFERYKDLRDTNRLPYLLPASRYTLDL